MYFRLLTLCTMLILVPIAALAQPAPAPFVGYLDTYQVDYFPNTTDNDGVLNLVNTGAYTPANFNIGTGFLCANIYLFGTTTGSTFDRDLEQMQACCTCPISRNGSRSIRARQLLSNTISNPPFPSTTVKVVWTRPANDNPNNCSATALPAGNPLAAPGPIGGGDPPAAGGFATGGRAWLTKWHAGIPATAPVPPGLATPPFGTETEASKPLLTNNERNLLGGLCNLIWFSIGS